MRALLACSLDLILHGPAGGPALAKHELYAWLHTSRLGRVALASILVGVGLSLICAGQFVGGPAVLAGPVIALLPVALHRRELAVTS